MILIKGMIRFGIMSRTSINEVNNKRHLGLGRKTLILHSLKNLKYEHNNKCNKQSWILIANYENTLNQEGLG